jgi:hypothetical protein
VEALFSYQVQIYGLNPHISMVSQSTFNSSSQKQDATEIRVPLREAGIGQTRKVISPLTCRQELQHQNTEESMPVLGVAL